MYLWLVVGLLLVLAIAIHPVAISWIQDFFGSWKDECPGCGSIRKCYPVEHSELQAGMISTTIESVCPKCGVSTDPGYLVHRPDPKFNSQRSIP